MYLKKLPKSDDWNISTAYINEKKCLETFGKGFSNIYFEYVVPFSPESVTHRHQLNDNLILELVLGFCRVNKIPSLSEILQNPNEGDIFFSLEKLESSIPKATGYYEKFERLSSKILINNYPKKVVLEYSNQNITCSTGSLELTRTYSHVVIGKIYSIDDSKITLHPLVMGPPIKGISYFNYLPEFLRNKSYSSLEKTLVDIQNDTFEIKQNQKESNQLLKEVKKEIGSLSFILEKMNDEIIELTSKIFNEIESYGFQKLERDWEDELFQIEVKKLLSDKKKLNFSFMEEKQIKRKLNDSEISVKHKIKFVIPLLFLRYEGEIEIGNKQKLPKTFDGWKNLLFKKN